MKKTNVICPAITHTLWSRAMGKTGIMICGHGSRSKSAEAEFGLLAERLKERYPDNPIEYGFLEYSAPNIHM